MKQTVLGNNYTLTFRASNVQLGSQQGYRPVNKAVGQSTRRNRSDDIIIPICDRPGDGDSTCFGWRGHPTPEWHAVKLPFLGRKSFAIDNLQRTATISKCSTPSVSWAASL
jgi:hypothetical protein